METHPEGMPAIAWCQVPWAFREPRLASLRGGEFLRMVFVVPPLGGIDPGGIDPVAFQLKPVQPLRDAVVLHLSPGGVARSTTG